LYLDTMKPSRRLRRQLEVPRRLVEDERVSTRTGREG
jgi:hypothetical protein